ncbi:MAG: helix-turn-helix domain-containing protein [Gallionella sp.]|nr:helix-turn-helix domain-containing protein [Gallionella sp.]
MSKNNSQNGEQPVAVNYQKIESTKLLVTPVEAGAAIGYAPQTVWNLLSDGEFPIPTVQRGKRKMVRVSDLIKFVDELHPASTSTKQRRPGRPTKAESISKKLEKRGVAA